MWRGKVSPNRKVRDRIEETSMLSREVWLPRPLLHFVREDVRKSLGLNPGLSTQISVWGWGGTNQGGDKIRFSYSRDQGVGPGSATE